MLEGQTYVALTHHQDGVRGGQLNRPYRLVGRVSRYAILRSIDLSPCLHACSFPHTAWYIGVLRCLRLPQVFVSGRPSYIIFASEILRETLRPLNRRCLFQSIAKPTSAKMSAHTVISCPHYPPNSRLRCPSCRQLDSDVLHTGAWTPGDRGTGTSLHTSPGSPVLHCLYRNPSNTPQAPPGIGLCPPIGPRMVKLSQLLRQHTIVEQA